MLRGNALRRTHLGCDITLLGTAIPGFVPPIALCLVQLTAGDIPLIAASAIALAAVLVAVALIWRRRNTPAEKERRRRASVNRTGRMTDGVIIDFEALPAAGKHPPAALFHYSYSVGGVDYSAAQDVFTLQDRMDLAPERYIGSVQIKYEPGNGSNSIVFCEEWSGLRPAKSAPGLAAAAAAGN